MFDHLIQIEASPPPRFQALEDATCNDVLAAQIRTADWLEELGVPSDEELDQRLQTQAARKAFTEIALNADTDEEEQKAAIIQVKTPEAVRHLVGMLSAYDWEFVEQARELRGYVVAKILEDTKHPDARIRLKALQMLGNVTEVAAFTERIEVRKTDMNEAELNERLQEKLRALMNKTVVAEIPQQPTHAPQLPPANDMEQG